MGMRARCGIAAGIFVALGLGALSAQSAPAALPPAAQAAPAPLTLADAINRARANSVEFLQAVTNAGIAVEDRKLARDAMLPNLNYDNTYLYTQGNRFIANNGVHEYVSQGAVHEDLYNGVNLANYRRAEADEALARAQAELATRGLVATVTADYYTLVAAGRKVDTAQQALADAQRFLGISQDRERAGEAAHADVIKAQIEVDTRQNALTETRLAELKARMDLAVLLFPDFRQNFTLADDLEAQPPLPPRAQIDALAGSNNPQIAAAQASLRAAQQDVAVAHSAYLPTLSLDYWYGIDAPDFATRYRRLENLASSAQATLNIPIWNWGANASKVRQADLSSRLAQAQLSATQRQLLADVEVDYAEAETARGELATLLQSRDDAAESLRLTGLRYQAGEATILELVDAQNTLTDARNAYDDGLVRYRVAIATLQTLTGTF